MFITVISDKSLDFRPGPVPSDLAAMVYRDGEASRAAGGEYGDVRACIDNDKLNAYLANNVPALTVPVTIKQFKVRTVDILPPSRTTV
jgi:hypothetical protein